MQMRRENRLPAHGIDVQPFDHMKDRFGDAQHGGGQLPDIAEAEMPFPTKPPQVEK